MVRAVVKRYRRERAEAARAAMAGAAAAAPSSLADLAGDPATPAPGFASNPPAESMAMSLPTLAHLSAIEMTG